MQNDLSTGSPSSLWVLSHLVPGHQCPGTGAKWCFVHTLGTQVVFLVFLNNEQKRKGRMQCNFAHLQGNMIIVIQHLVIVALRIINQLSKIMLFRVLIMSLGKVWFEYSELPYRSYLKCLLALLDYHLTFLHFQFALAL